MCSLSVGGKLEFKPEEYSNSLLMLFLVRPEPSAAQHWAITLNCFNGTPSIRPLY